MCRSSKLGMVYFLVYSKSRLTIIAHRAVYLLCCVCMNNVYTLVPVKGPPSEKSGISTCGHENMPTTRRKDFFFIFPLSMTKAAVYLYGFLRRWPLGTSNQCSRISFWMFTILLLVSIRKVTTFFSGTTIKQLLRLKI